jgi:hypothetical protein
MTMDIKAFLDCIQQGIIPDSSPDGLTSGGRSYQKLLDAGFPYWQAREICIKFGMWAIVDKIWTKDLAEWIGQRKVLEVMAGAGWLAKALADCGVKIMATDDYSWDKDTHKEIKRVYPIQNLHALEAITIIEADILLCSWPPYEDDTILQAARLWGPERPIIYIGEWNGCNTVPEFFDHFQTIACQFPMVSWDGIHDHVFIGYYRKEIKENGW